MLIFNLRSLPDYMQNKCIHTDLKWKQTMTLRCTRNSLTHPNSHCYTLNIINFDQYTKKTTTKNKQTNKKNKNKTTRTTTTTKNLDCKKWAYLFAASSPRNFYTEKINFTQTILVCHEKVKCLIVVKRKCLIVVSKHLAREAKSVICIHACIWLNACITIVII